MALDPERPLSKLVMAANAVLIGAALACLLVVSYYAYHYGWTGRHRFTSWAGVVVYYVLPAALAVSLLASLRLRPAHKINLALFLCSAGVSIYALEILLTVWLSLPSVRVAEIRKVRAEAAQKLGRQFDTRSDREFIADLRRQGIDAIPSIYPQAFLQEQDDGTIRSPVSVNGAELFPLGAIANKVVVLCNETGRFVTYRSDEHGFNNPPGLWSKVPADIVAVGDSYVHGYCVDDNFVTLIRERYPATVNLGMEGNGPLVILATIKEYARAVKPNKVLWFHYEGNDLKDLSVERRSPLLMRYLPGGFSQNLFSRQAEIDRALSEYLDAETSKSELAVKLDELSALLSDPSQLTRKSKSIIRLARTRNRLGLVHGKRNEADAETATRAPVREHDRSRTDLLYEILVEAKESVAEWGGELYFVYLPTWNRYGSTILSRERDDVLAASDRAGLPTVDIHRTFSSHHDPLTFFPFGLPGHYTEEGNRLVAEEVLRRIATRDR